MASLLAELSVIGRDAELGGYSRHIFDAAETRLRAWFVGHAERLGLRVETDANANLWAWWGGPGSGAIVTGSHLDSVPGGGAFDGPLGVVSALVAVERLAARGVQPERPLAIVVFAEEEGSRFGVACRGSRLATGLIEPAAARALIDRDGVTFAEAARGAGIHPDAIGAEPERIGSIAAFVELHVEQGRGLVDRGAAVGVGTSILAHGRWRVTIAGAGNHAGTTAIDDRRDPMVVAAAAILAARSRAGLADAADTARATVGRLRVVPGATNAIASAVTAWLDVRAATERATRDLVAAIVADARAAATTEGCTLEVREESFTARLEFDGGLGERVACVIARQLGAGPGDVPRLATGAGHDAGILSAFVPTAMIYVRNPSGVSHAPGEDASDVDCEAGVAALTAVLEDLLLEEPVSEDTVREDTVREDPVREDPVRVEIASSRHPEVTP